MTTNGKFSVLAVILVTLMVSCAFVPAVNALSNSEDENTAIMTSEETETQNENVDLLSQLAAMFGLDKDSGLQGILDAIGLSELLDQETIDKILESGLNPSELLKILNEKIPEIPTDLSKILSILSDPGDLNGTYHFDVLDLGFVHFTDLTVTIEVSEAGTLQVFEIEAGSAMVAALGISAGVEDLQFHLEEGSVCLKIGAVVHDETRHVLDFEIDLIMNEKAMIVEVSVHHFGIGYKIDFQTEVETVGIHIPEFTLDDTFGDFSGAKLEDVDIFISSNDVLDVKVLKATKDGQDITPALTAALDEQLKNGFDKTFNIPGTIGGFTVVNGIAVVKYKQTGNPLSISVGADIVNHGGDFTVTEPYLSMNKDGYNIQIQNIRQTETSAEGESLNLEINTIVINDTEQQSWFQASIHHISLTATKDGKVIYGVYWGKSGEGNALVVDIFDRYHTGSGIVISTRGVDVEFSNIHLWNFIPATHTSIVNLDDMTKMIFMTLDSVGKTDKYFSAEYSDMNGTEYITMRLVDNDPSALDSIVEVNLYYPENSDPFVEYQFGVGVGDPTGTFASVMRTSVDGSHGISFSYSVKPESADPTLTPRFTMNMTLTDDALTFIAYADHYALGNVSFFETGVEFAIAGGVAKLSMYGDGVTIKDDKNKLEIGSVELGMIFDSVEGTDGYGLSASSITFNDELVGLGLNYDIFEDAETTTIDGDAIVLGLDLGNDGIKISDNLLIKGTATLDNGVVKADLHLDGAPDAIHFKLDGNNSVDICFHTVDTNIDFEFKAVSTGVTLGLNIPSFGKVFEIHNATYNAATNTLTIGQFVINGNGGDTVTINTITLQHAASGFTVSADSIQTLSEALVKSDITMGSATAKAFGLKTENTNDGVKRTVSADVQKFSVENPKGTIETGSGSFSEVSVDGIDQTAQAELNGIHVLVNDPGSSVNTPANDSSSLLSMDKVTFTLDGTDYNTVVTNFELNTENGSTTADTITASRTFDASAAILTYSVKTGVLKLTQTGTTAPLTVSNFEAKTTLALTAEDIDASFAMTVGSITLADGSNTIDAGTIALSYSETEGFAFTFDHIDVSLTGYEFKPTSSSINADIHMNKDSKAVKFYFYADKIVPDVPGDTVIEIDKPDIKFTTDADGKITENTFTADKFSVSSITDFLIFTSKSGFLILDISLDAVKDEYSIGKIQTAHQLFDGTIPVIQQHAIITGINIVKADGLSTMTVDKMECGLHFFDVDVISATCGSTDEKALKLVIPYDMEQLKTADLFEFTTGKLTVTIMEDYELTQKCSFKASMGTDGFVVLTASAEEKLVNKTTTVTISEGTLKNFEAKFNLGIGDKPGVIASLKGEFLFKAPGVELGASISSSTLSVDANKVYTLTASGSAKYVMNGNGLELNVDGFKLSYDIVKGDVKSRANEIVITAKDEDSTVKITAKPDLTGIVTIDPETGQIQGTLEVNGNYVSEVTENGVTTKYSVTTEDTLVFNLVEDEEDGDYILTEASWAAKVTKVTIEQSGKSAEVNINTIQLQAAYSSENGIQLYAEGEVDFDFSLPTGSDHKNLTIRGAEFEIGYTPDDGFELELRLDFLEYGTDNYAIKVAGLDGSLDLGFDIDTVTLMSNTKDNVVDVTFLDCWYVGEFLADSMAGTINGVDVARLNYSGEKLTPEDYYNGTFYFSYTEGIKAFKNGDDVEIPEDAIMVIVPTVEVTFKQTAGDKTYEIPIGDVITLDGYFDIYDHAGFFALTTDYYVVAPYSVDVVRTQTVDNLIDGQGIAKVPGSGIVFTPESLGKISVPLITIKTGGDITAKISLDGLKRLATGTQVTMLGFTKEQASEDNVGDIIRNMTPANAQKVLAGTLLIVDVGRSTVTDGLGNVEITLPFYLGDSDPAKLTAYHIYQGEVKEMNNCVYKNGYVTFTTDHFSTFLICEGLTMPADRDWFAAIITICVGLAVILIMTAAVMRDKTQKKVKAKA